MQDVQLLKRRLEREIRARKEAESILEQKAMELHRANEALTRLNENLEQKIKERTIALEQTEKRYRQIIESARDFIFRTDPDGYFTYVNPIASQKLGYKEEDIVGSHFTEFVLPGFKEEYMERYIAFREEQKLETYEEFPIVAKNGDIIWIGQHVRFLQQDGIVSEALGVARDISERKVAEDSLLTTQSRLKSLIYNLQSAVLVEDENRKVVLANKLFCELFTAQSTPQEMEGTDCRFSAIRVKHLFKEPDAFIERVEELLESKERVIGEEIQMANGLILERDYIPIYVKNRYLGHLWKYRDITERHRAEEKLKRSEEKYRGIIENMELGLMEVDNNHKIVKVYDWFCDMTGYAEEELIGKNAVEIFLPEHSKKQMEVQQAKRIQGETSVYEVQIRKKDGTLIWVLISGAPILDTAGNVTGSIGIHYDITHQKKLQHELEKAKQVAEEAEQAEKLFLARMSHEIRTPLNAIIGMAHLIENTVLSEEQKDYIESLKSSSDILHKLISDILDLSKISAGGMEINARPFDLLSTIKSLEKTFQHKLENSSVVFKTEIDPGIGTMMIGDDLLLNQILLNLIGNASKFTSEGEISLQVDLVKKQEQNCWFRFRVKDTGIGISEKQLQNIFENFKQANGEIHSKFGGTGLGLPITKQLVELQGGSINVQSKLGVGTTFSVQLQYKDSGEAIPDKKTASIFEQEAVEFDEMKILVVEDNFMNRKYIAALLEKWEIAFEIATDGFEALKMVENTQYDLIFMDISMPKMNGYDTTIRIRNTRNPNQNIPVIALTASAMISKKDKAYEVGMSDYLAKPFKPHQLRELIQKYAPQKDSEQTEGKRTDNFVFDKQLDTVHLERLYRGDLQYASIMFQTFLDYTMVEYENMADVFEQGDFSNLQQLAHKLKPNFSLVGLTGLEKKMLELEKIAGSDADKPEVENLLKIIDQSVRRYKPLIKNELEKMKVLL